MSPWSHQVPVGRPTLGMVQGERWRYKDPWTHQKNQTRNEHMLHSMTHGDSNGARLVGPPQQTLVDRSGHGGNHLSAPLHRPLGPSRRLRVVPPHKIPGRLTCDVDQLKVGYTPPTLATCADDLGRPSKAVSMTVYPRVEKWEAHGSLTWHPSTPSINRGCMHPLSMCVFKLALAF